MIAMARASKIPRRTSRVALKMNMIALKQADPVTKASKRSSQACKSSDKRRSSSMPSDHAVSTVKRPPKRTGITWIIALGHDGLSHARDLVALSLLLQSHAHQDHTELDAVLRGNVDLVNEHREGAVGVHREPVRRNWLFKMLDAGRGVANFIERFAVHQVL